MPYKENSKDEFECLLSGLPAYDARIRLKEYLRKHTDVAQKKVSLCKKAIKKRRDTLVVEQVNWLFRKTYYRVYYTGRYPFANGAIFRLLGFYSMHEIERYDTIEDAVVAYACRCLIKGYDKNGNPIYNSQETKDE